MNNYVYDYEIQAKMNPLLNTGSVVCLKT